MGEHPVTGGADEAGGHGHGEIHLPPNSWIPIWVAFALMVTLVGLLPPLGPWVGVAGMLALAGGLVAWYRAARAEYRDLPESLDH